MKNIRITYITAASCLTLLSGIALAKPVQSLSKDMGIKKFAIDLGVKFQEKTGKKEKGSINQTKVLIDSELEMNPYMSFLSRAGVKYETGSTQSAFNERRNTPDSAVVYDNAYIRSKFFKYVQIDFGSLDNNSEKLGSYIQSNITSLGASEKISYKNDLFEIGAMAIQSKPLNDELSSRIESVEEGSPKFFYEKIYGKIHFEKFSFSASIGQFAYDQLSGDVADLERYMGNTISGTNAENSSFDYKYKGKQYRIELSAKLNKYITVTPSFEIVENESAPETINKATLQQLVLETSILDTGVKVTLSNYSNERDAIPTYYTGTKFTANNEGKAGKITILYNGFETSAGYLERNEIKDLGFSDDEKMYLLEIRKTYDFI